VDIVSTAICATIFNDLGNGSSMDLYIITKGSFIKFFGKLVLRTNFQIHVAQMLN
jgi:hypothetical protein